VFSLDTNYNMVSTALDSGELKLSSQNFTQTKNTKEFYEFYKRGNVVDLLIDCTGNMQVVNELMVFESIPMLLNGGHFAYMFLFLLMPFGMSIIRWLKNCFKCCNDSEEQQGGKEF
jgi:hypothetical protein